MNMTMQQPVSYPFYMGAPRLPVSIPWSAPPFHQQQFHPPFVLPQQRDALPRKIPTSSSFSNTRYHHLKQSTHSSNRRPHRYSLHNDVIYTQPSKSKSISDLEQLSQSNSGHLSKAQSWNTLTSHRRSNLSVDYAKEMNLARKPRRKYSPQKKKAISPKRRLPSSSPPKRKVSFRNHRKQTIYLPERGVIRISTLDEMPIANHRIDSQRNSINTDRISTKGSISNSSKHQMKTKKIPKGNSSIDSRSIQNNNEDNERTHMDYSDTQSSLSNYSHSSLQLRLSGSLRNDPLISAAMEDYRELQRSSSQTTSLISRHRNFSRDSLRSNSIFHPSASSSSSSSDNHSQSSFTSLERSEIRELIKTIKRKDTKSLNNPLNSSPAPPPTPSEQSIAIGSPSPVPAIKPRKSSLTEELDRKFETLRARDPDQEINYVTPSSICKRKKTLEKPAPPLPPLPTFDELLRKVQLRPIDKSTKPIYLKQNLTDNNYENPLLSIPISVPVPCSSPTPVVEEMKIEEPKHEYAVPIKKSLPQISHFQPSRNLKFNRPNTNIGPSKRISRSLSMLSWFHNNLTNPFPTTFQPNQTIENPNEYGTASFNENIYTPDIDMYSPPSIITKTDQDHSLQIHLDNQTILTDDIYSEYEAKQTTNSSTILDDFSHLFARKHKLHKKSQRCSIM